MTTDRIKLGMNFLGCCRLVLGLSLTLFTVHLALSATNVVTCTISTNATWSRPNLIVGTVVITNSSAVTIEPGTQMLMNTGATLVVYGRLQVNGTSNAPVLFTRATT